MELTMTTKLTWAEIRDMQAALPHFFTSYRMAKVAAEKSALAQSARRIAAFASRQIVEIGDKLTRELVVDCDGVEALVRKYLDHGYRPTLKGAPGSPEAMLADIYDFVAESHGLNVRAYRGSQS